MNYIPTVIVQEGRGERAYDIYSRLLADRIVMIQGEVNDMMSAAVVAQILFLASESKEDIRVYINSPGGSISAGMAMYDAMRTCGCDVATTCIGHAASMGAFLLCAGTKGKRTCLANSEVMIHSASSSNGGTVHDMDVSMKHLLKTNEKLIGMIAEFCGQPIEKVSKDCERDCWLSAEESLAYGLVDKVI